MRTASGRTSRACGFTLIELLVVMVIIATLLTIAAPRYFRSVERAKEAVLVQDLAVLRDAIDKFQADRARYPETLDELVTERYIRGVPVDPITKSRDTWVAVLSEDPEVPGVRDVHSGAGAPSSEGIPYNEW